jgi:hypothetical protein
MYTKIIIHQVLIHIDSILNTARVRGPLSATVHEAGCGPSKIPDLVCVCVSYNRVKNPPYL